LELLQQVRDRRLAAHVLVAAGRRDESLLPALHTARVDAIIHTVEEPVSALKHARLLADQGQVYVSPSLRSLLVEPHPAQHLRQDLTSAELRVLRVIGTGSDNQEAAKELTLSEATVQTHRRNIMRKLKVSTSAKLVREAVRLGIVHITIAGSALPGGLSSLIDRLGDG
jgi:two-component system nitrate/nitrite response regulator NarP